MIVREKVFDHARRVVFRRAPALESPAALAAPGRGILAVFVRCAVEQSPN